MFPLLIKTLQALNNPTTIVLAGLFVVCGYYLISWFFHYYSGVAGYSGPWRKNSWIDITSSVIFTAATIATIVSLIDLACRNELTLEFLLIYYVLLIFLFAFIYNIIEWHRPGAVVGLLPGWAGELQSVILSVQIMTSADYTSAKPARLGTELLASIQSLLGILFIAVFIAKAVGRIVGPIVQQGIAQ